MARERVASNHTSKTKPILKVQIMVVDDDNTSLRIVSTMLKKCNEQGNINIEIVVFSFNNPLDALETLRASKNSFDLIVTDLHMPGMNGMDLQKYVYEEFKIPVIIMSSDDKESVIIQSLEDGASFFLVKPVTRNDLRNVWQYAVTAKKGKSVAAHHTNDDDHDENDNEGDGETRSSDSDKVSVDNDVGNSASSVNETTKGMKKNDNKKVRGKKRAKDACNDDDDDEHEDDEDEVNPSAPKKAKVVWTNSLHNRFLQAINHIGLDKAVPKKILEFMNVPGLTRENVASHLQKYRIFLKRVRERVRNPPRNFLERPNMSSFASSLIQPQPSQLSFHPGSRFSTAAQASSPSLSRSTLARPRHAAYACQNSNTRFTPSSKSVMRGSMPSTLNQPHYGGLNSVYNQTSQSMFGMPYSGAMNTTSSLSRYQMEAQNRSNTGLQRSNEPVRRANLVSAIGNIESSNYNNLVNMSSSQFLGQYNANNNNKNYAGFQVAGDGSIYSSGAPLQLSNHCPGNSGAIRNRSIDPYVSMPNVVQENTSLLPVFPPNNVHTQNETTMFNAISESRTVESEIDLDALLETAENINNNHILHNQDLLVQERQEVVDTNSNIIFNDVTNQELYPTFEQPQENGELMDFELSGMLSAGNNPSSANLPSWGDVFVESLLGDYPF